jgi:hypothetical protein
VLRSPVSCILETVPLAVPEEVTMEVGLLLSVIVGAMLALSRPLDGHLMPGTFIGPDRLESRASAPVRRVAAVTDAPDVDAVDIGERLGFYRTLAEVYGGAMSAVELAARTGTHVRYARAWMEQQTLAGVLEVVDPSRPPTARRYRLPEAHIEVQGEGDGDRPIGSPTRERFDGGTIDNIEECLPHGWHLVR